MNPLKPVRKKKETVNRSRGKSPAGRDFGQLALWMAATLAGVVSAVLLARGPHFRRLQRSLGVPRRGRSVRRPSRAQSLPLLKEAIVGNSRHAIAEAFGIPRGAVLQGTARLNEGDSTMWRAQTWYYSVKQDEKLGMAIQFEDDAAASVEFFKAPGAK